jgi:nicotinamide mononucleotide adenylyltransferase
MKKRDTRGLYIGKYPPPGWGKYQLISFEGKKYEKVKRKRGKM